MKVQSFILFTCSLILGHTPSESVGAAVSPKATHTIINDNTNKKPNMRATKPFGSSVKGKPVVAAIKSKIKSHDLTRSPSEISANYGGWDLEQVPEDASSPQFYGWDYFDKRKYILNTVKQYEDIPRLDASVYFGDLRKSNDGYLYAINARRPYRKNNARNRKAVKESVEGNHGKIKADGTDSITDIALPGSLKYGQQNYSMTSTRLHQAYVYFGKDGQTACLSLRILLEVDGAKYVESIPDQELTSPKHHYFAAVVEERNDGDSPERNHVYRPKYFRLNQGGIWSFKDGTSLVEDFVINHNKEGEKSIADYTKESLATYAIRNGKFCGYFIVPSGMKAFIEKARR